MRLLSGVLSECAAAFAMFSSHKSYEIKYQIHFDVRGGSLIFHQVQRIARLSRARVGDLAWARVGIRVGSRVRDRVGRRPLAI